MIVDGVEVTSYRQLRWLELQERWGIAVEPHHDGPNANGRRARIPAFFREFPEFQRAGYPKNELGFTDWRALPPEGWAQLDLPRCKICHPSPVGPFPDCPHGHYLDRERLEAQLKWEKWRTEMWRIGVAAVFIWIFGRSVGALFFVPAILIIFWLSMYQLRVHRRHQINKLRLIAAHPETPYVVWEKRKNRLLGSRQKMFIWGPVNEPWRGRVF